MNRQSLVLVALLTGFLLLPLPGVAAGTQYIPTQAQGSWGLGVVVPDKSGHGGNGVAWAAVRNVTAVFNVPDITNTTATTYAITSIMLEDGTVLQTATGIYPGSASWLVYSMFVNNIQESPQTYHWSLNSSLPVSSPGQSVAISIYISDRGFWSSSVENLETKSRIAAPFGLSSASLPMGADQEVFALESYSTDPSTFSRMGNLTLYSVLVDGRPAEGGWYVYGDWSLGHGPPYVVGGLPPPPFIGLKISPDGTASWYYAWASGLPVVASASSPMVLIGAVGLGIGLGGTVAAVATSASKRGKRLDRQAADEPE